MIWYIYYIYIAIVSNFFQSDWFISENKQSHVIKDSTKLFKVKREKNKPVYLIYSLLLLVIIYNPLLNLAFKPNTLSSLKHSYLLLH